MDSRYSKTINIENCLKIDPFDGDEPYGDECTFRDKLVIARKDHECNICGFDIPIGMLYRSLTDRAGGIVATHRYCYSCCVAQAVLVQTDDYQLLESRYEVCKAAQQGDDRMQHQYYVEIVKYQTTRSPEIVEKRMGPLPERKAKQVEHGANINLNHKDYYVRKVEAAQRKD